MTKAYILGGYQTDFERNWNKEGKGMLAILREAVSDGCRDAGLDFEEVAALNRENKVACFVGNFIAEKYCNQGHLGALSTMIAPEFRGVPTARYEAACASGSVALDAAITKIRSGDYDVAVVIGWELMKTVDSKTGGGFLGHAAFYETEAQGVAYPFPKLFSRLADAYVERHLVEEKRFMDALAVISTLNYDNAKRNPNAQTRHWFMDYEQASTRNTQTNPLVSGRLAISDCSQITDGAAVVVLASERYCRSKGLKPDRLPYVSGWGHRVAPMLFSDKLAESDGQALILPWTRQAILDAYRRAGLSTADIDVFETHDCFTSSEYAAISAFGLTEPGKEFQAVEEGWIAFDGKKPMNPSGGLIGCGHPVGATGVRMFLDLYRQVSGRAGKYQVPDAKRAMMLNIGGSATTNYSFIVSGGGV